MNWDRVQGNWKQFMGGVQEKWGKLTEDHIGSINGSREVLMGKLQEAYGIGKDEADRQINEWQTTLQDAVHKIDIGRRRADAQR
jgi:uncharacterized protein YjbJ (UPF0337 family)